MKNQKGITLITVIMTVVLLIILAGLIVTYGTGTFEDSKVAKFEIYMKMIQKRVDIMMEGEINYQEVGNALTIEQKNKLREIIPLDDSILTREIDIDSETIRYFSSSDIEEVFDLEDVNDDIVINFANRDIISLNGIEKDNVMHYTMY